MNDSSMDMPLANTADVTLVLGVILDGWKQPVNRPAAVEVQGVDAGRVSHILRRVPGDRVAVRRVGIFRDATILGVRKHLDATGLLEARFTLARGFNAAVTVWRLGVPSFTELGTTTVVG